MEKVTYRYIADCINKSEQQVKWYKTNNPELLELVKLGAFCKKNNLDIDKIKKLVEVQEAVKNVNAKS